MSSFDITHRFITKDDKELRGRVGIYAILNKANGHLYVGQSSDLLHRKKGHFKLLRKNKHYNKYLQNAYNLYGAKDFGFVVIEFVKRLSDLNDREQYWIEYLAPAYNLRKNVFNPILEENNKRTSDVDILKVGEVFVRQEWHKWVYGWSRRGQG